MPFAQNALRKIRRRFISRSSTKKDTQQDSPSPNPSKIDVYALPDTQGLDRKDALVDNLADNLQRAVHLHMSLEVAATVLNGVDAWLPLLGASLVLAKEGIVAVQASKALKHSAHAYFSHVFRLINTMQQKLERIEGSGEKTDPRDIKHFENFKGLLELNLKTLRKITQMSNTQAWFGLKNAEDEFRRMQIDIESFVSWLSLKASYDLEKDAEEMTKRMAQDRKEIELWAQQTLKNQDEMKGLLKDLGQKADLFAKMLPDELKSLRADVMTFRRRSQEMETDDTSPSMGQPTISHANTTVVYWAEELGNQIVWKAARIETLLSAHKAHCQNNGSSLVINDVMADALTDLVKLFDDSCPPGLIITDRVPKLSASTSTKASSTQLKSPVIANSSANKDEARKRSS